MKNKCFIPKKDTQQEQFVQKYPSYDGSGILIAIIDTGIDVSLPGLQKTSTGLPKVVDCFDFTGAGDVDTSTIKKTEKDDDTLFLLSGRKINIQQNWKNPSNEWHLGIKCCFDLYTKIKNSAKDYSEEHFVRYKKPWKKVEKKICPETISKYYNIDCIVWNDGKKWRTCLLPLLEDKLEDVKILTNFCDEHEYCNIFDMNISCSVKIQNDGNLLQLFIPHLDHGSFVAQICAANFFDKPENNGGLAPGAQIVSFSIDLKIGSNKTKTQVLEKSLQKCIEMGVDIVNLSFIDLELFNERSIVKLIKKMVNNYGIILIKGTGNYGPLSSSMMNESVECTNKMFFIGASSSQTVLTSEDISNFENNNSNDSSSSSSSFVISYSSRGPLSTGARGVTFTAPSTAYVPYPAWHPSKCFRFDGTSCATPIAAGSIACLLSALKANSIKYSPATVKLALSNTSFLPENGNRLEFGNGIIKINDAYEYLKIHENTLPEIIFPKISLNETKMEGIIICKTTKGDIFNYCINVEHGNIQAKKQISWILKLSSNDENQKNIEHSKIVKNNEFNVKIDTNTLKPGKIYFYEIHGFHPSSPTIGPIWHLPITVIVPVATVDNYYQHKNVFLQLPSIFHTVIYPPETSEACTLKIIEQKSQMPIYEKMIIKVDHNKNGQSHFLFSKTTRNLWNIDIRWKNVFEICIFENILYSKNGNVKADLQIFFEKN